MLTHMWGSCQALVRTGRLVPGPGDWTFQAHHTNQACQKSGTISPESKCRITGTNESGVGNLRECEVPEGKVTSMKIAVIGASGQIGAFIRDEALARGHQVTAIMRHPEKIPVQDPRLHVVKADILKDKVDELVKGHDAVISAYNPGWKNPDMYNQQIEGYKRIISGVKESGIKRLLVVGGAGSLEVAPGVQVLDTASFSEQVKKGVLATREVLYMLKEEKELEWTFLSPPTSIAPGERTGHYRVGKDQLLKNKEGESKISTPDYAVAMLDELENRQHIRERFTAAY
jgi:putative NADH-flavin reductase